MIHLLIPYYPSNVDISLLMSCLEKQKQRLDEFIFSAVNAQGDGLYWGECMQLIWERFKVRSLRGDDNETVCIMNTDLRFHSDFFSLVERNVKHNEILVPWVYEDGKLVDGGIHIDWSKKRFDVATSGTSIDCFSPRGICMTLKTFRESGGFNKWLPHYASDYDWSIRQLKRGVKTRRLFGLNIYHEKHNPVKISVFSKLNPANPWYWTIFILLHCPLRYIPINLLKAWLHPWIKRIR